MRSLLFGSAALLLALAPVSGHAASPAPLLPSPVNPALVQAQTWQGWWERDHYNNRARDAYWRLPPGELSRYNRLQVEIDQLVRQRHDIDERIARAEREQRQMLSFDAGRR